MPDKKDPEKLPLENPSAMMLGFNMAAGMGIFTYIGYKIDEKTGGGQGWTLAGIFMGLFYCGYEVWKLVRKNLK